MFSSYRAVVKNRVQMAYESYNSHIQAQFIQDPKSFWGHVKNKRVSRNKPIITKDGLQIAEKDCACEFANYFKSVYDVDPPSLDAAAAASVAGGESASVQLRTLSLQDVRNALAQLKPKHSVGPDGIPPFMAKDCASVLASPLLHIFNMCLRTNTYPKEWKVTRVIPIPKSATATDVKDFRPIAVLSTFAKVFESMIYSQIYKQIQARLNNAQHGFRQGRSTDTNLLCLMRDASGAMDA